MPRADDLPACLQVFPDHVRLSVHVHPGAPRTEVLGLHADALKIRLAAPPVDGKANAALVAWLAKSLGLPRGNVEVWQGSTSRQKLLRLRVDDPTDVVARVRSWLPSRPD